MVYFDKISSYNRADIHLSPPLAIPLLVKTHGTSLCIRSEIYHVLTPKDKTLTRHERETDTSQYKTQDTWKHTQT